jgi:hypothetical protein
MMVAAFCCAEIGVWKDSMRMITPGAAESKDDWWNGEDTQKQAKDHLEEFDARFPGCRSIDVYDNSTGHNCKAVDSLDINETTLNLRPGGKNRLNMRNGYYIGVDGVEVSQPMHFVAGETLRMQIKVGRQLCNAAGPFKAAVHHDPGEVISESSELIGVAKGMRQVLLERGLHSEKYSCKYVTFITEINEARTEALETWQEDRYSYDKMLSLFDVPVALDAVEIAAREVQCACAKCVLGAQKDFATFVSGLEEV